MKVFSTNFASKRKCAFTLAEVLITLGIIGVVAAMTLPTLIGNYNKNVVETKLKKFYSIMNQAVKFSEVQYGEFQYWDDSNFSTYDANTMETWWNKYFAPHVKTLKTKKEGGYLWVYLADGTKLLIFNHRAPDLAEDIIISSIHLYFYPKANNRTNIHGKDFFTFFINRSTNKKYAFVEPYKVGWNGTREHFINGTYGCRIDNINTKHYCTALIQYNNWKIPDDYPYKF